MAAEDRVPTPPVDAAVLKRIAENGAKEALAKHGGGPHDPGMEALIRRVDQLETDIRDVKASIGRLEASSARIEAAVLKVGEALVKTREDVAELKGRVAQMPTAWQLLVGIVGIMGATFGLLKMVLPH